MENKPDHWARVASADLEHVRKSVSDMFKSHQLKQLRADQTLQTRLRHAQFGQVALSRLGYGADVHIQPDHLAGFYLVQMPQYGTATIRCGGQTVDSSPYAATILNPNEDVDMVWHANNEQLMLKIDRNLVEQAARGLGLDVGPQGLLFPVRLQAHTQPSWQIMLRYVLDCARNYEYIRRSPLIINQLEQLAVTTLLDLHPPAQIQALNPTRILPRHLKKVATHLHEQAHLPVTVDELSTIAGVSSRTLQQAFKEHYGVSPMQYLRQVRLDRLRHELIHSNEPHLTLADLAMRWGFAHQGRFSAEYRSRFGETPGETLQRVRGGQH
ncbi:AraC family transcriptional regulator [Alcaligenes faecalis]|uniref:AraC family transcriptional regulator n=1 Tax=Alcaligenes faecalis TaxID=511 RepID=UPI002932692F|nr:AraC family transcriptional regulator [Alcaligenes faecalis]MDV2117148.1 AraC family transcriptional regulator [Alcaligenes faecalis]